MSGLGTDAERTLTQTQLDLRQCVDGLALPRRAHGATPVRFIKKGPAKPNGSRCFGEETYVRVRDESRPATASSADWHFLHSDRRPPDDTISSIPVRSVQSLLPARDPDLVE